MKHPDTSIVGQTRIAIKGAGEMASGIAVRLHRAGFTSILMLETDKPMAVRRAVSFCEAVHDGSHMVEDITAVRLDNPGSLSGIWDAGHIAVAVDPQWKLREWFAPRISVDAIIAKRNLGTRIDEAPLVVALGPGFTAGVDAHRVIETNRGHNLGRVFSNGSAQPNTGVPGDIGGFTVERVLRAPVAGIVENCRTIGDSVEAGDCVCTVGDIPVPAKIPGVVRGCIRSGVVAEKGLKLGDIDPRGKREYCFTVSEKARALGGSVLETVCAYLFGSRNE